MVDKTNKSQTGFTLVELLIVIVVIAILAAITLVTYNNIQDRARDTKRISDINMLVKGMTIWTVETGKTPYETGTGSSGSGSGWVYHSSYTLSIEQVLKDAGLLSGDVRDPKAPNGGTGSYMFYKCNVSAHATSYAFLAILESPDVASNQYSTWRDWGCAYPNESYGMNYARILTSN